LVMFCYYELPVAAVVCVHVLVLQQDRPSYKHVLVLQHAHNIPGSKVYKKTLF
jgi:hypothetical protein